MKVEKQSLLLIAGIVWMLAGFNIFRIGIELYYPYLNILNIIMSLIVFSVFQSMIFGKLVNKHTKRIYGYENEKQPFYNFFDKPSFIIMISMMTFGMVFRSLEFVSRQFIAVFYSGLGASLLLAGILFGINYFKSIERD